MLSLNPVSKTTVCKCCFTKANLYGVVDFHHHSKHEDLPCCGIPIYYHRCPSCDVIFTTAFDYFTLQNFKMHIYNNMYNKLDPDYIKTRPENNAAGLYQLFKTSPEIKILDYGGGAGLLATKLKEYGFLYVDTYDPMIAQFKCRPKIKYDLIVAFEVLEHLPDPLKTLTDIFSLAAKNNLFMFSTLTQPREIDFLQLNWEYVGPRHGHITLYATKTLEILAQKFKKKLLDWGQGLHGFYSPKYKPAFAKFILPV